MTACMAPTYYASLFCSACQETACPGTGVIWSAVIPTQKRQGAKITKNNCFILFAPLRLCALGLNVFALPGVIPQLLTRRDALPLAENRGVPENRKSVLPAKAQSCAMRQPADGKSVWR
jgi:hypothetical protein